ncbi:MAG: divergent polysaccharide deacetylase family protein [Myxococcales bacterium]|nr:divergent polysaccharide deacetylase family protein [Myxococcales bacterium]
MAPWIGAEEDGTPMGRLAGLLTATVALVVGAAGALTVDRVWLRPQAPVAVAPSAPPVAPRPPPTPVDSGPARALVVETLEAADVSARRISHGLYPLRGAGRPADATLDLVSFDCPTAGGCGPVLTAIEARARSAGLGLVGVRGGDRPQRPVYRALVEGDRPALALRAMPPGPRLTVVVGQVGREPALLDALLALPAHVVYAVLPDSPGAGVAVQRLDAQGREVLVHLPMGADEASAPAPGAVTLAADPEAAAARVTQLFDALPSAVGVAPLGGDRVSASRRHMVALLEVLRARGRAWLDGDQGAASLAAPAAKALGVRLGAVTHRLGKPGDDLATRLKAVEAALVLEGRAVVLADATPEVLVALRRWLGGLNDRGIALLRLSEIAL